MTSTDAPLLYASEPRSVQLMNTLWADSTGLHDALESVTSLRAWALAAGVPGHGRLTGADLDEARRLRDALRRLAAHVTDDDRPSATDTTLEVDEALGEANRHLRNQAPVVEHSPSGRLRMTWSSTVAGFGAVLGAAALEGSRLVAGAGPGELKACHGPGCVLYFVKDGVRREWCSAGCGNRARVARHYRRHKLDG